MLTFAVNVGLGIPGTSELLEPGPVISLLRANFAVLDVAVVESDSEPTVSAVCAAYVHSEAHVLTKMGLIAITLGQEAVAVAFSEFYGSAGHLVGPKAKSWGEFNPKFFFTTGGARLSDLI